MGDISAILPASFGLKGRATKERGHFLVSLPDGCKAKIIKTNDSPGDIHTRYTLLEQLASAGFPNTDRIMLSAQGAPYIMLGRETYIMTHNISGRELNLDNEAEVCSALQALARFHTSAGKINKKAVEPPLPAAPSLHEAWQKQLTVFKQALKQVNRQPRLSDFDVLFIKHAPAYLELTQAAQKTLAATDYAELRAKAIAEGHICHNAVKEENFPLQEDGLCFITRFSNAAYDLQLADLAGFIRRYAARSRRTIPIEGIIKAYSEILPLPDSAADIIHAELTYPWLFMKTISQYYSKKRGFTPAAITGRMLNLLEEQANYDAYINGITSPTNPKQHE